MPRSAPCPKASAALFKELFGTFCKIPVVQIQSPKDCGACMKSCREDHACLSPFFRAVVSRARMAVLGYPQWRKLWQGRCLTLQLPIHPIHRISRSVKAVGSAGFAMVKGQGMKTMEQMVSFDSKAEFRASESPCKKLILAGQHRPKKEAKSSIFPPSSAPRGSGANLDTSVRVCRMLAAHPRWQVSTAGACVTCQHRWLAPSPGSRTSRWSYAPKGLLEGKESMDPNQAIFSILSWWGASIFPFKQISPSISTEACGSLQKVKAAEKGPSWSLPQALWSKG